MHLHAVYNMAAILNRLQWVNMEWEHLADAIIQKMVHYDGTWRYRPMLIFDKEIGCHPLNVKSLFEPMWA